jgi:LysM repeat protein
MQLKEWNHLRNYNIAAGTRLKVGKISIATKSDPIQSIETKDSTDAESNADVSTIGLSGKPQIKSTPKTDNISNPKSNLGENSIPKKANQNKEISDTASNNSVSPKPNASPVHTNIPSKVKYHKVQPGQTLYSISTAYGMDVETLKRLNGLRSNNIAVGRLLRVR